jgi:hypothetical protein
LTTDNDLYHQAERIAWLRQRDVADLLAISVMLPETVPTKYTVPDGEEAARRLTRAGGVTVSGTIGVLLHLIEQRHLTLVTADVLLAQMRQADFRAPASTLQRLLGAKKSRCK